MSKIKIENNDESRVILTEILPYEVPMLFSNDGYYLIVKSKKHQYFIDKLKQAQQRLGKFNYTIPFQYEIAKSNDGETRCLSVIHPLTQLNFIEFYSKYDSIILYLCAKSPLSLRRINKIAKYHYSSDLVFQEEEHKTSEVEIEPEILDKETKIYKSYFTYQPVDLIYKFYEKNDYQRLEQRYDFLWQFDISKCFYHIYTHSITWAIKDKASAKMNTDPDKTFENKFDRLMQLSNYNETNGIVVGPEISRIFAEIILQQIDLNVLKKLDQKGYKLGIDYEIRRYVDDFFAFANNEEILSSVLKIYKSELAYYKLYINSEKTERKTTPFITNIAVGKRQIRKLSEEVFEKIIDDDGGKEGDYKKVIRSDRNFTSLAQEFKKDFQCIVKQNNLTYDSVNKDVIRFFKTELVSILKSESIEKSQDSFQGFLIMFLDIIFYCYSLNINTSATFKMAQIIVLIVKQLSLVNNEDFKHTIFSRIAKEAEFVMTTYHRKTKMTDTNIETINLLIALKKLGEEYYITEKKIREYFNLTASKDESIDAEQKRFNKLNYFQIISLLYYFDNNTSYQKIKERIESTVLEKFRSESEPFIKAIYMLVP